MTIKEMYIWAKEYGYEDLPVFIEHYHEYLGVDRLTAITNHSVISPNKQTALVIEV